MTSHLNRMHHALAAAVLNNAL